MYENKVNAHSKMSISSPCAISAFGPRCVYLAPIKKGRSLARLPHSFDSKGKGQCVCAEKKRQCERRKRPMCVRLYSAHPSNQQWQEARDRGRRGSRFYHSISPLCIAPNLLWAKLQRWTGEGKILFTVTLKYA